VSTAPTKIVLLLLGLMLPSVVLWVRHHVMCVPAGQTEESALPLAVEAIAACVAVHGSVMQLFYDVDMPASNVCSGPASDQGLKHAAVVVATAAAEAEVAARAASAYM
jgi:hypothetical protein